MTDDIDDIRGTLQSLTRPKSNLSLRSLYGLKDFTTFNKEQAVAFKKHGPSQYSPLVLVHELGSKKPARLSPSRKCSWSRGALIRICSSR